MMLFYFSNTVHYCRSSMPRLSQTLNFLQSASFRQAQSVHHKLCVGNVTPLSIITSFCFFKAKVKTANNVLSFTISSSRKGEQSRLCSPFRLELMVKIRTTLAVLTLVDARMNLRVPNFFDRYVIGSIPDYRTASGQTIRL